MEAFLRGVLRTVDAEGGRGDSGGEVLGVEGKDGTLKDGAVLTCMAKWDSVGREERREMINNS